MIKILFFLSIFFISSFSSPQNDYNCGNANTFCIGEGQDYDSLNNALSFASGVGNVFLIKGGEYSWEDIQIQFSGNESFPNYIFPFPFENVTITMPCETAANDLFIFSFPNAQWWVLEEGNGKLILKTCHKELYHGEVILIEQQTTGITIGPLEIIDMYSSSDHNIIRINSQCDGILIDGIRFSIDENNNVERGRPVVFVADSGDHGTGDFFKGNLARVWVRNCIFERVEWYAFGSQHGYYTRFENNYLVAGEKKDYPDRTQRGLYYYRSMEYTVNQNNIYEGFDVGAIFMETGTGELNYGALIQNNLFYCKNGGKEPITLSHNRAEQTTGYFNNMRIQNNIFHGCGDVNGQIVNHNRTLAILSLNVFRNNFMNFVGGGIIDSFPSNQWAEYLNYNVDLTLIEDSVKPIPFFKSREKHFGGFIEDESPLYDYEGNFFNDTIQGQRFMAGPFQTTFRCPLHDAKLSITQQWGGGGVDFCTIPYCYGVLKSNKSNVCSGHGACVHTNVCFCFDDGIFSTWTDDKCDRSALIIGNILLFGGGIFVIVIIMLIFLILSIVICVFIIIKIVNKKGNDVKDVKDELKDVNLSTSDDIKDEDVVLNMKLFNIHEDMVLNHSDITLKKQIGAGGSNTSIYVSKWKGQNVACKVFTMYYQSGQFKDLDLTSISRELKLLGSLKHPNVISFFGVAFNKNKLLVVMEYCANGDLRNYINTNPNSLSLKQKISIFREIASVMDYIHGKSIIHRDLKPENVLLDSSLVVKLVDFGLSRTIAKNVSQTKGIGTPKYMAPEITMGKEYSNKIDVFSFGIMIYEILTEDFKNPYNVKNDDLEYLQFKIANDHSIRPPIDSKDDIPSFLQSMAKKAWANNENDRPTFKEIYNEIEEKYFNKENFVIYTKKSGEDDSDAVDHELKEFSISEIKKIFKVKSNEKKFYLCKNDEKIHIKNDCDVFELLQCNDIIEMQ